VMNMLVFPDGYAGMVNSDGGFLSYSFCVRRDRLEVLRNSSPGRIAGDVIHDYILESCPAARPFFASAKQEEGWLSTGPLRPGLRSRYDGGVFSLGNAAGEAHPTIADGISMSLQAAWLLARSLGDKQSQSLTCPELDEAGRMYDREWLKAFRLRIRAAGVFAWLSLNRRNHALLLLAVRAFPGLLTLGARLGGIVEEVVA
jgi:2-polyprenyl-6-methoxyphenol hydroxylase-like FAD-dependent oxidoreductase